LQCRPEAARSSTARPKTSTVTYLVAVPGAKREACHDMPFDGKRLIDGSFQTLVEARADPRPILALKPSLSNLLDAAGTLPILKS
jgi:hypothetical protein